MSQLTDELFGNLSAERRGHAKLIIHNDGAAVPVDSDDLVSGAMAWARCFGVGKGRSALIEAEPTADFVVALLGCFMVGLAAIPVPPPSHGPGGLGVQRRVESIRRAVPGALTVSRDNSGAPNRRLSTSTIPRWRSLVSSTDDDTAVIQFTSGSTADPKGCVLSHRAVVANLRQMRDKLPIESSDVGVGWLPLHHDMGLFGTLLVALFTPGAQVHLLHPSTFRSNPLRPFTLMSKLGATVAPMPASALRIATMLLGRRSANLDLRAVRNLIVGAEPIVPEDASEFTDALGRCGLDPYAFRPAYGMAEATLYLTSWRGLDTVVPSGIVNHEHHARSATVIGDVDDGTVCVVAPDGSAARDGEIGPMNVRSDSLMDGYLSPDRVQPADVDADGWMATSDVGFAVGNRLAVVGRSDEAIVALGRKIYPIDVERAVASALGDQRMLPVAFGVTDSRGVRDRIVVAVATRKWSENQRRAAELAVVAETGVRAAAVLSVPPSAIPRTTSGKVRRDELARLYVESPRDLSGGTG